MKKIFGPVFRGRTWAATLHLLLDLPFGIAWFTIVVLGLSLGAGLIPLMLIGLPILAATVLIGRAIGGVERTRARALLGASVTPPDKRRKAGPGAWTKFKGVMGDVPGWKGLLYGSLMLPIGCLTFSLAVTMWSVALAGTTFPVWAWAVKMNDWNDHVVHGWEKAGWIGASFVVGLLFLIAAPHVIRGLAAIDRGLIRGLLGGSPSAAELRQRVETLTASRDASVDTAEAERRRIERDLHDGVQAQLVNLAMDLGRARQKLEAEGAADPAVVALVERAHDDSKKAVADLRNLVRGIHPAVLTDRGLDAAVSALAARSPVPVDVNIALTSRPPSAIESAAYFVIAEALANAAKYSAATLVRVDARVIDGLLRVEVTDDGLGGADIEHGGGLAGLASRVSALEGRLRVASPPGGPTTVLAELPLGDGASWPPPVTPPS